MKVLSYKSILPPLDTPVNSYYLPELKIAIDAGIEPPEGNYEYVYITHWHWDHTLGISHMDRKKICIGRETLKILENKEYEKRPLRVLIAGGIKIGDLERVFLETMREKYSLIREALGKHDIIELDECPHIKKGTIKYFQCPGHSVDHVCYSVGDSVFVGDTLLAKTRTTIIDFEKHKSSLIGILAEEWKTLYPGHGDPIDRDAAGSLVREYIVWRCKRVYRLLYEIARGTNRMDTLAEKVYGVKPNLAAFVVIRTMIGYLESLERNEIIEVDRSTSPWTVRLKED
jgi:ribonuclease/clavin/mitogillin